MTTAPPTTDPPAVAPPPLVLPPRTPRRVELRRQRRRRRRERAFRIVATVAAVLVVVVAVAAALVDRRDASGRTTRSSRETAAGRAPSQPATPAATRPRVALIAQTGAGTDIVSLTLLARGPGTEHVVLIPPGTMAEVPAFGLEAVGKSLTLGGAALLQATVENLVGVAIDDLVLANDAVLAALVGPAGDLRIDIPQPVEEVGTRGDVQVLWEAGPTLVAPDDVGRLLAAKGEANDLARLARHQAFWDAWAARLARRGTRGLPAGSLRPYLDGLRRGTPQVDLLPVEALDAGGGEELYKVQDDELDALVRRALPHALTLGKTGRPRVQVLNGTGRVGIAQDVTLRLVQPPVRARVRYTGNAESFDHTETQIVFYDRSQQAVAERVRDLLGVGRVVLSRNPLGIVDITVVVGKDFE